MDSAASNGFSTPNGLRSPLLDQVERGRDRRKKLYGRLCGLGVFLRLLTMLNGLSLLAAAGYSLYNYGAVIIGDQTVSLEARARLAVEHALMAFSGGFLWILESSTTTNEVSMRNSLGLAFSSSGRLGLFLFLGLCSAPLVNSDHGIQTFYATGGAIAFLVVSALLQAWVLSCTPEYRTQAVALLDVPKVKNDPKPDAFPQIYQRDEGTHLHLGVLIPGFASRETCTMSANCSNITLVGDVSHLEAPYSPVDSSNSVAGPFGSFSREVQLATPVDITVPVESRMGLGICEFRFQKGFEPAV